MPAGLNFRSAVALWLLRQGSHVGLLTASGSEATGVGRGVVPSSSSWGGVTSGASNVVAFDLGVAGAGASVCTQWAVWDAATGGSIVASGALSSPVTPAAGVPVTVPVGGIVFEAA